MSKTGYVIDERYIGHAGVAGHPERPERMQTLLDWLEAYERDGLVALEPRAATRDELLLNHHAAHVDAVAATTGKSHQFDPDTHAGPSTYDVALLAAGGTLAVVDAAMSGRVDNGFALVRPPGHHAEADRAMGFCFFNNVAIAARHLIAHHGIERVLVVDWDVHHGNGTQRSFFADDRVLFVSTHQHPLYPGTGAIGEVGVDRGAGFTVNVPLSAGQGDDEYAHVFSRLIVPVAHRYRPQFVLISAGFDHHARDPLGGMNVTKAGMASMARSLLDVAVAHADGRCVAVLEGGYDLTGLREGVEAVFDVFGEKHSVTPDEGSGADVYVDPVQRLHDDYWDF